MGASSQRLSRNAGRVPRRRAWPGPAASMLLISGQPLEQLLKGRLIACPNPNGHPVICPANGSGAMALAPCWLECLSPQCRRPAKTGFRFNNGSAIVLLDLFELE